MLCKRFNIWFKFYARRKNRKYAVLCSNVALTKRGYNLLRIKGCRIGIEFCLLLNTFACCPHGSLSALGDLTLKYRSATVASQEEHHCLLQPHLALIAPKSKQSFSICRHWSTRSVIRLLPHWKRIIIKFKAFLRLLHQRLFASPTLGSAYRHERQPLVSHLPEQCLQSALQPRNSTQALLPII